MKIPARPLFPGCASGPVVKLEEPLSFWGGFDPVAGEIVDAQHPQCGTSLIDRVVVLPSSRGSSSTSGVFAEALRLGTAPAALVLARVDAVLVLGAIVGEELYARRCPIVVIDPRLTDELPEGAVVLARSDPAAGTGEIEIQPRGTGTV